MANPAERAPDSGLLHVHVVEPEHAPDAPLHAAMATADAAAEAADADALSAALRQMLPLAPEDLAIDIVAVFELCGYDLELAQHRWQELRERLRRGARYRSAVS